MQLENDLIEIVQLVGKDSLGEDQKATLKVADIIKEEFLQQNAFSDHDCNCPLYKTIGMMKCIVMFYDSCRKAVSENTTGGKPMTMAYIETGFGRNLISKLSQMKFILPDTKQEIAVAQLNDLADEIENEFRKNMNM